MASLGSNELNSNLTDELNVLYISSASTTSTVPRCSPRDPPLPSYITTRHQTLTRRSVLKVLTHWPLGDAAVIINSLHAKFFRGIENICLHFMSFLHIDLKQVVQILYQILGWVGLWGFLWRAPSAKRKDHHRVSIGWSSVWHCSNTGLSSTQYEQIPIILGVWPFWLTPFFFRSITFWRAYG